MNNSLIDLSGKIDSLSLEALGIISEVANSSNIPFLIVGATAKDIFAKIYDLQVTRATMDIDIGVNVSSWEQYSVLHAALIDTGYFNSDKKPHRIKYKKNEKFVDLIPFGGIGNKDKIISWPPDHDAEISTIGFDEAYQSAQTVRLNSDPALDILIASPVGLAIMKIVAWNDRIDNNDKDASDLLFIIRNYYDAGNTDRIYDEHRAILKEYDFDMTLSGARLLGRDIGIVLKYKTEEVILSILQREIGNQEPYRLVEDMVKSVHSDYFSEALQLLGALTLGIKESRFFVWRKKRC